MSTRSHEAVEGSVYLQVYPSTLEGASRMEKIARVLHPRLGVAQTELVGVHAGSLPRRESIASGVDIVRLGGSNRPGNVGRVLRHVLWQPRVFLHYRRRRVRAIAAHNVWVLPLCHALARSTDAPLVYNPHELETETATMRGAKQRVARFIESRYIRRCAVVSVVNSMIGDWYAETYGITTPVPLPNLPEIRRVTTTVRERLGIPDAALLFAHTGHLSEGRNIPAILEAFAHSEHHVVFFGEGPYKSSVLGAAERCPNIHWHAPVPADEIVSHVEEADAGLCLVELGGSLSDRLATPNKLMESLVADRPALCTDFAEARRWLGPEADQWILQSTEDLGSTLARITKTDTARFRGAHPQIPTWDSHMNALVQAYDELFGSARQP